MVLQGDFIPPLCTLSQLSRLCFNIRVCSERSTLIAPHLLLLKLNKDSCVINVSLIIVLLLTSTSSLAFHYSDV